MHYVVSDIHNDYQKFCELLKMIEFSKEDKLFILGDLFDRSDYNPNPVDLYFKVMELGDNCSMIRGNHDEWLAAYIFKFYQIPEWKRRKTEPYQYNTFRCLTRRLVEVDVQNLARQILTWPLQLSVQVNNEKYLLAHAMTSKPECTENKYYYLMGNEMNAEYLHNGIEGYISICGHRNTANHKIWRNEKGNLIMCDCGCGFRNGKLGCLCLETKEEFYVLLKKKDGWSLKKCEGKVKYYGNLFNYLRASTGNCNYDLMFFRMALNKNEQQVECVLKSIQFACNNNITYSYELYPESTKNGDGKIDESGTNIYYNPHVNFYDSEMEICNAFMDFIELNELKAKHKSNLLEGEIKK